MSGRLRQLLLPLGVTAGLVCVLLVVDPFGTLRDLAARLAGPVRQDAMVTNVYRNPVTQEITNGEAPLSGLKQLAAQWCSSQEGSRFVLMGNSQTFTMLLAPSERGSDSTERTYPDQIIDRESAGGRAVRGYRLSAPNLSYAEVLWYLRYLLTRQCMVPDRLIVQLNYESFRKVGIRPGMLELLADRDFYRSVMEEADSQAPYAAEFRRAIDLYHELEARTHGSEVERGGGAGDDSAGDTGARRAAQSHSPPIGALAETWLRGALNTLPAFHERSTLKVEFLTTLYLLRVNVLGITPTTKRSLGGVPLAMSVSALERVGELCARNHIRLEFFLAPQNPRALLYRTEADRREYTTITSDLTRRYAWRAANFENLIPAGMWGIWVDGPDPIHFGRAAHAKMAQLMIGAGLVPDGG